MSMATRTLTQRNPGSALLPTFTSARSRLLQRKCACGGIPGPSGECEECKRKRLALQPKLAINEPNDRYEQEADRVAEAVVGRATLRRPLTAPKEQPRTKEKESLQRKAADGHETLDAPPIVDQVLQSSGQPLDPATRTFMEERFGYDFGGVRVHTDARAAGSAQVVNALAYTVGRNVVFGAGQYAPHSAAGRRLIAHELTHTLQQARTTTSVPSQRGLRVDVHEKEAGLRSQFGSKPHRVSSSPVALHRKEAFKTSCDVKVDRRDELEYGLQKQFRTVGKGKPQFEPLLSPAEMVNAPCLMEVARAHEEQHVKAAWGTCRLFKACIDQHSSKSFGQPDPIISYDDFLECRNTHHNGLPVDCIADERSAYEVSIKKATQLVSEPRCAKETASLQANIAHWNSIKDHDPDCKTQSTGSRGTAK
jgi:Domain of unknown function (DUF4157)